MKIFGDVKREAKRFYHKYPKLTVYGGIGAGVVLAGGIAYAATRPKKKQNDFASLVASSSQYVPYAMTLKGYQELQELTKRLTLMSSALASGAVVFVQPDAFKKIFMHGGVKVLDLIPSIFYNKENKFSTDELANHSHCQTQNAAVVQLGNDWAWPFYNTVYRGPDIVKIIDGKEVHYAGVPIDPKADPAAFDAAVHAAMNASINNAIKNGDFGGALNDLKKKFGVALPFALPSDISQLLMYSVPHWTRDNLARFARDLAAKNNKPLPTTDSEGKALPQASITLLHSSLGAMMVAGLIDVFESHDEKVNPCIKVVTPELVFEMFMVTIGTVLGLAVGPALSAVSVAIKFATTINKLAELAK